MSLVKTSICLVSLIALTGCLETTTTDNPGQNQNQNQTQIQEQTPPNLPIQEQTQPPVQQQTPPPITQQTPPPITQQTPPPITQQTPPPIEQQTPPPVEQQTPPPIETQTPPPVEQQTQVPVVGSADLQGLWVSQCFPDNSDNTSTQLEFGFADDVLVYSQVVYFNDQSCTGNESIATNEFATFVVTNGITSIADGDAKHINITYSYGSITASQGLQNQLASQGTNLAAVAASSGVTGDINRLTLQELGRNQAELYSIYRLDDRFDGGQDLRIGEQDSSYTGDTPELRHVTLNTQVSLVRQQ